MRVFLRFVVALLVGLSGVGLLPAQEPAITGFVPQAARPGAATEITITGSNLAEATGIWTSFPSQATLATEPPSNAGKATFRLELPADVPVGVHGLRVATKTGVSPLRLFVVDDLPSVAMQPNNTTPESAQTLNLPCAVDGKVANLGRHYFKFQAEKGQQLTFEVLARRLGSALDPMLRLLDSGGHELNYSDDVPGLSTDSRFTHIFENAGEYTLELRDIRYQGGDSHTFRLRIGDFPAVTVSYPMAVERGTQATLQFAGPDGESIAPLPFQAPTDAAIDWLTVSAKRDGGASSAFATVAVTDQPQFVEQEDSREAIRVELGTDLQGRFEQPGDSDRFVFTAKKGQAWTFAGITRQAGSPTDLYLRLRKPDGSQLAIAEDNGTSEGILNAKFPDDGEYTLVLEDLHRRGGRDLIYWVTVRPTQPNFTLTASTDTINIPAGGTAAVTINADRQNDYKGPIEIGVLGLPEAFVASPTVIGEGRNSVVLTIRSRDDRSAGQVFPIRIVGKARIGEREVESAASVADVLKSRFNAMPVAPLPLETSLAVAVAPAPAFTLRTEPATVTFGRNLPAKVKILAQRRSGFDEAIALAVTPEKDGLPAGITAALNPIPKGQNEVEVTLSASDKAALGEFTAAIQGTLKQDKTTAVQIASMRLSLQTPLTVKLDAGAGTLKRGGRLAVTVHVEKIAALSAPVTISLQNLPKGVTLENVTVPADGTQYTLQLRAAEDATVGDAKITARAEAAVEKSKFEATSPATTITVE